jgi:outer membrane protein OmpA-like peptidoglycan-associated protein
MRSSALLLVAMLALCGCAGVAPPAPVGQRAAADQRAGVQAALDVERQWLQSWFQDTPVSIGQRSDHAVTVNVPREFCFDPGRNIVKPALAAVLDKVAESLRRRPLARLALLAAPGDAADTAPLAMQRALKVQSHLLSRGVPAARIAKPTTTSTAAVQLRMEIDLP